MEGKVKVGGICGLNHGRLMIPKHAAEIDAFERGVEVT